MAETQAEIEAAQALRYRVFYEEMAAQPTPEMAAAQRDFDRFDEFCDHVLVIDRGKGIGVDGVVGTYRLLRDDVAAAHGGFYSAGEYDISKLIDFPGKLLELGRSCVDAEHRSGATMQLMWQSIATYVFHHDIAVMFGCASLHGTDPQALALPLTYLYHHHLAAPALRVRALADRYSSMDLMDPREIKPRSAIATLPPLLKGYLRLGGVIGDGAVIDHQFNTTDVCVIVETSRIREKYFRHYERTAGATKSSKSE